jgi:hypothetical protein
MRGIALGSLVVLVGLGFGVHAVRGQSAATAQMANHKVEQGKSVNIELELNKSSNVDAWIFIMVAPEGLPNQIMQVRAFLPAGQTKCTGTNPLPVDAKLGKWMVSSITFAPQAGGGQKELNKNGALSFDVIPGSNVVDPEKVTVLDIK